MAATVWAHITDGVVDNVIVLDPNDCGEYPMADLIEIPDIHPRPDVGWSYTPITGWATSGD